MKTRTQSGCLDMAHYYGNLNFLILHEKLGSSQGISDDSGRVTVHTEEQKIR